MANLLHSLSLPSAARTVRDAVPLVARFVSVTVRESVTVASRSGIPWHRSG